MMITRDNYEAFFLDYLEGNLDERLIDQFLDFLKKNPDLKEELHLFENIQLPREKAVFRDKETLYRPALAENESFELKAVAYMEGDLKDKERLAFTATLDRNPGLQKEYSLFEKTRLTADTNIRYPQKEKLYRKSGTVLLLNWSIRVAAMLILLLGIYTLFQNAEDTHIAKVDNKITSVKKPANNPQQALKGKETAENRETVESKLNTDPQTLNTDTKRQQTEASKLPTEPGQLPTEKERQQAEASKLNTDHWQLSTEIASEEVEMIAPIMAHLEEEPVQLALAVSYSNRSEKINDLRNVVTLDEYLALKAKKATNDGVLSVHRLLRAGLNVASELSGDRLGYTVKNGKVSSLDFESKLLAFELPLEKK